MNEKIGSSEPFVFSVNESKKDENCLAVVLEVLGHIYHPEFITDDVGRQEYFGG